MIWVASVLLVILILGVLSVPLMKNNNSVPTRERLEENPVFYGQLKEIEEEHAQGLLSQEEAELMKKEVGKRWVESYRSAESYKRTFYLPSWLILAGLAVIISGIGIGGYAVWGASGMVDLPLAGRTQELAQQQNIEKQANQLAQQLKKEPNNATAEQWATLAGYRYLLAQGSQAAVAARNALALDPQSTDIMLLLASSLIQSSKGVVSLEAENLLKKVLKTNPKDPQTRFYLARASAQKGHSKKALKSLKNLASHDLGAAWQPLVRQEILFLARKMGLDEKAVLDGLPKLGAPSQGTLSPTDKLLKMGPGNTVKKIQKRVENLKAKLVESPDDIEGWQKLSQAYLVLKKPKNLLIALNEALIKHPNSIITLQQKVRYIYRYNNQAAQKLIPALNKRILVLEPKNTEALWMNGVLAVDKGHKKKAQNWLQQAINTIPKKSPSRQLFEKGAQKMLKSIK